MKLANYISSFPFQIPVEVESAPWKMTQQLKERIVSLQLELNDDFELENGIAIHKTAQIESGVTFKPPVIVGAHCTIAANAYFREGVLLDDFVKIGPSTEIKSSIICAQSAIAHLNYIGNSIIGRNVNFEGGSIAANHFNERQNKAIKALCDGEVIDTGLIKFGALVGDNSRIGANAVLSPGTILEKNSIVKRLALVEQVKED